MATAPMTEAQKVAAIDFLIAVQLVQVGADPDITAAKARVAQGRDNAMTVIAARLGQPL